MSHSHVIRAIPLKDLKIGDVVLTADERLAVVNGTEKVESVLGDRKGGIYLDIELFKQLNGSSKISVKKTNGTVSIGIRVPDSLLNTDISKDPPS